MSTPKRQIHAPGTYFITTRTWQSHALFFNETNANTVIETLLGYRDAGHYQLHSFVVMPEHIHVLVTPADEISLERAVQFIKGGSSHRIGLLSNRKFPLWQRGYSDHRVRDADDYAMHVAYIELNPVKRRLVANAEDYRYSSAHPGFTLDPIPQRLKPGINGCVFGTVQTVP